MQITLSRVRVLDLLQKNEQKKNSDGEYVNTGNKTDVLVMYPYGQDIQFKQAGCLNVPIDSLRVSEIKPLLGEFVTVELDQELTKSGSVFYRYLSMSKSK